MESYCVVMIETNEVVFTNPSYDECVLWVDTYGNIIEYTIINC